MSEYVKDISKLKDPKGAWRTTSLFAETRDRKRGYDTVLFNFKEEHNTLLFKNRTIYSLKKLYLELSDPTEYRVATEVFGGWDHWEKLLGNKLIFSYIDKYRRELDIKLKAEAITIIRGEATGEGRNALQAAKWLAEKGWGEKRKAGAPSSVEKAAIEKEIANQVSDVSSDYERIKAIKKQPLTLVSSS